MPAFVPMLAMVLSTGYALGQTLRESDQASLLDGVAQLADGQAKRGADFYNYDKQYLSYWLAVPPGELPAADPGGRARRLIGWVNMISGSLGLIGFWLMWWACLHRPSIGTMLSAAVFTCCPLILLCAGPASSATISGGFLLALVAVLSLRGKWRRRLRPILAPLLVFAAVAARADAVLCLPLMCWASFRGRSWRQFRGRADFWSMGLAAVAALVVGRWLVVEPTTSFYGVFFMPKVFAAYLVFGLGGCGLWWLAQMVAIPVSSRHRFHQLGALLLALPMLFYWWQLFSPRHLMTTALVTLAAGSLWKGRALFRFWRSRRPRLVRVVAIMVLVAALLPLAIGIYLPFPKSPRPVLTRATEFPTADGLWPMGATLSFLSRLRHADDGQPIDHNQQVWKAALLSDFSGCGDDGRVAVLESDMRAYLLLAARFQGREAELVTLAQLLDLDSDDGVTCAYVDDRALRVSSGAAMDGGRSSLANELLASGFAMQVVSPPDDEQLIVRVSRAGAGQVDPEIIERLAVAKVFGGDEFRAGEAVSIKGEAPFWRRGDRDAGISVAFSSREMFSVNGREAQQASGGWWVLRSDGREIADAAGKLALVVRGEAVVRAWLGVLPDYMSRGVMP